VQYSLWYVVPNTLPVGDLVTFAHLQELQTVQYSLWYVVPNTLPVGDLVTELPGHRQATYWVQHTTSCIPQSKLLKTGKIVSRNMSNYIGFINKPLLLDLAGFLLYHR